MFSEIGASEFFVILDAFDFVAIFFNDPNCSERISKGSDKNPKFGKFWIVMIFDDERNTVNVDSILI